MQYLGYMAKAKRRIGEDIADVDYNHSTYLLQFTMSSRMYIYTALSFGHKYCRVCVIHAMRFKHDFSPGMRYDPRDQ